MRIDHRLGNGETQSKAAETPRDRALTLLKSIKDFVDLFLLNPDPGVSDEDFDLLRRRVACLYGNAAVLRCEFHAVLDQVPKNLLQAGRVALDVRLIGA